MLPNVKLQHSAESCRYFHWFLRELTTELNRPDRLKSTQNSQSGNWNAAIRNVRGGRSFLIPLVFVALGSRDFLVWLTR